MKLTLAIRHLHQYSMNMSFLNYVAIVVVFMAFFAFEPAVVRKTCGTQPCKNASYICVKAKCENDIYSDSCIENAAIMQAACEMACALAFSSLTECKMSGENNGSDITTISSSSDSTASSDSSDSTASSDSSDSKGFEDNNSLLCLYGLVSSILFIQLTIHCGKLGGPMHRYFSKWKRCRLLSKSESAGVYQLFIMNTWN
uniref:Uncharacterized protein n=1 Tax=Ditylenchus dipsaci TaxID=166011 RepID=A0A915DXE8_9BILA